jgi:tetratricopeptide (TPR) repeat protein
MLEASRQALELARQTGDRNGVSMATNNMAESARQTGDWDEALTELRRETEVSQGDDLQRMLGAMVGILSYRGEDVAELLTPLMEYMQGQIATGEPVWQRELDLFNGSLALSAGRFADAVRLMSAPAREDPFNAALTYADVALAALLDRDLKASAAALEAMESTGSHGTIVKLAKRRTRAGIAALEGRIDEALSGFAIVLDELRRLDLPFPTATTGLVMCALLDPSLPAVAAAEKEARSIFDKLRARAWLDRLDDALAGHSEQASEPSSRPTQVGSVAAGSTGQLER